MENVKEFIVEYIEREYSIPDGTDLDTFNFMEEGYIDSMGLIQFIAVLEDEFGIEFSDEELSGEEIKIVGKLAKLIEDKTA
jgi:Phosphopantetheine attachment site.